MTVGKAFGNLFEQKLRHPLVKLFASSYEAEQITACTELHHEAYVIVRLKRVIQLDHIPVMCQMLQYLHISGDLLLALNLLVQLSFPEAFHSDEVATELMLGDADLTEGALSQFVAYAIEFD